MQDFDGDKYTGEPKYRDEKDNKYSDIESFQNRTYLPEIEIKDILKKKKGNIITPREEGRVIKVRIINKNYLRNNKEEEKREKEYKKRQE